MNSDVHEVTDIYCPSNNYVVLTYRMVRNKEGETVELVPNKPTSMAKHVCITSGIQTTTTARLHLYKELEKLNDRVLYMDTDSFLFVQHDENEYCPPVSSAIGGLSNELEDFRKRADFEPYIDEFVCIGPKTYAYRIVTEPLDSPTFEYRHIVKCKGLRLTCENSHVINMETMKSFLFGIDMHTTTNNSDDDTTNFRSDPNWFFDKVVTTRQKISTLKHFRICTETEKKIFGMTFDKRRLGDDFRTYPYGYLP